MGKKKSRENNLWKVDSSLFQHGPEASFLERHVLRRVRSTARLMLFGAAFAYPFVLISLGISYGAIVFWAGFAGSAVIMGLIITKAGYAKNFAGWDIGYRRFVALPVGFAIAFGAYLGLLYSPIGSLTVVVLAGVLALVFLLKIRRMSSR